jgi:hypothetical protein
MVSHEDNIRIRAERKKLFKKYNINSADFSIFGGILSNIRRAAVHKLYIEMRPQLLKDHWIGGCENWPYSSLDFEIPIPSVKHKGQKIYKITLKYEVMKDPITGKSSNYYTIKDRKNIDHSCGCTRQVSNIQRMPEYWNCPDKHIIECENIAEKNLKQLVREIVPEEKRKFYRGKYIFPLHVDNPEVPWVWKNPPKGIISLYHALEELYPGDIITIENKLIPFIIDIHKRKWTPNKIKEFYRQRSDLMSKI